VHAGGICRRLTYFMGVGGAKKMKENDRSFKK
jgi:hypothetical protein